MKKDKLGYSYWTELKLKQSFLPLLIASVRETGQGTQKNKDNV